MRIFPGSAQQKKKLQTFLPNTEDPGILPQRRASGEMADALASGASGSKSRGGSSPLLRIKSSVPTGRCFFSARYWCGGGGPAGLSSPEIGHADKSSQGLDSPGSWRHWAKLQGSQSPRSYTNITHSKCELPVKSSSRLAARKPAVKLADQTACVNP